jgi:ABC transport system ATP-binding/permease protein
VAILLSTQGLAQSFAGRTLFRDLNFSLETGERVGLIGPNGAGKSSLIKILVGQLKAESGTISQQRGLKIGYLPQSPQFTPDASVLSTVLESAADPYDWEEIAKASELLGKMQIQDGNAINPESLISALSGGWKKRVALARELLKQPDLLILDEPTNHLDVEGIMWLESLLRNSSFATLTVTHDRVFLDRVSTRILELDRRNAGGILSIRGSYADYLEAKANLMAGQEKTEDALRNTLRRETEWLRRGAKARTTKQQARIDRHEELTDQVEELGSRNKISIARLDFSGTSRNPKRLLEAEGISKSYDGKVVIPKMDLLLTPRSRVGLLGTNGAGKSTLIRILLGKELPDTGTVFRSDQLEPVYFEQNRESLDPETSVLRTICPSGDHVEHGGRMVHVKGYLDRFLFKAEQMEMPAGRLSGGEQSRLLLARLMLRRSNMLVLDEPTNDLDIATLNVLEDVLQEFDGAVILVTHDRYFLDRVASEIIAIGPEIQRFNGLEQWEDWKEREAAKPKPKKQTVAKETAAPLKKKLSFKEQQELKAMESSIAAAEAKVAKLQGDSLAAASQATRLMEISRELAAAQTEVEKLYARWAELEKT